MTSSIIQIDELKIPPSGIHLIIKLKINNKIARFVIDTGASQTVLDMNRMLHFIPDGNKKNYDTVTLGIGTNKIESSMITVRSLKFGTINLKDFEIVLLDLAHVNQSYSTMNFKKIDGILGSDLLKKYNAVIDFKKLLLFLKEK